MCKGLRPQHWALLRPMYTGVLGIFFITSLVYPTRASELKITGRFKNYPFTLDLSDYQKNSGWFDWSMCVLPKSDNNGLVQVTGNWRKSGDKIQLSNVGSILKSSTDSEFIVKWTGSDLKFDSGESGAHLPVRSWIGNFEGRSSATADIAIDLGEDDDDDSCDSSLEEPGLLRVLLKPGSEAAALKYFRSQDWKIQKRDSVPAFMRNNGRLVSVPIGSERNAIARIKNSGFVFDAGPDYVAKTLPQVGSVLVSADKLTSASVVEVQSQVEFLFAQTWQHHSPIVAVPRQGNDFRVELRGPLSKFIDIPKLPGYWIATKLEILIVSAKSGNRLYVSIRDAKLIRWPETGKGDPPSGFGTNLDCDGRGDTKNMRPAIALTSRVLRKASELFDGKEFIEAACD
jgi:hypothetical protein